MLRMTSKHFRNIHPLFLFPFLHALVIQRTIPRRILDDLSKNNNFAFESVVVHKAPSRDFFFLMRLVSDICVSVELNLKIDEGWRE
jgi:hypothetical protein